MFRFRKFYSIADLKKFELFKHIHYIHLYQKKKVCAFCFAMYNKIDNLRLNADNSKNRFIVKDKQLSREAIIKEIKEYGHAEKELITKAKKIFSNKFYRMIRKFDKDVSEIELYSVNPTLLNKFEQRQL